MNNRGIAQKIYEKLLEKGAGIGNASIPIISLWDECTRCGAKLSFILIA